MEPRYKLRTTSQYGAMAAFSVLAITIVILQVVQVGLTGLPGTVLFCIGIVFLAMAFYAMPYLEVNAEGLVVANTLTTVTVPFRSLIAVESRWGMRLTTTNGESIGVRVFSRSSSSRAQYKPQRAKSESASSGAFGSHSHDASEYKVGNAIPLISSGTISMRATTYSASSLIDEMRDAYPVTRKADPQGMACSRAWAWDRIGIAALGAAAIATGTAALF
ncbi:hypothetical protein [Changpingibacter yushuensis]|uniref:hypothetical protein n=1 Tax=Changpingibacter yushuensis TaxID=2758440 RepID=UPI0015F5004F|nr:hypothetical protein [Changpingibacter yushuensis]